MDKQVYDLTGEDLTDAGVWYFPTDDSVDDELSVRPLLAAEEGSDVQIIVRTRFEAADGAVFLGYIYWVGEQTVNYRQPNMFVGDECVSFWNGLREPHWEHYSQQVQALRGVFPIRYVSEALMGLPSLSGTLEGLYYVGGVSTDSAK
ncbi:hypothetical protein [Pseudomonas fontis]|uniref:Uncharacterized protein n=1 Tax=Pseudomonas fontis TaxID=2942633 RepID=A0ABT5NV75_9PSED|nr:hypothetical protein [Pseudomonas fontis]MDD0974206.1 hypothetical protein [Pseudomonas fontis]MDD0992086.1 hypothetical protein [Pseudomonas fontis]